MKNGGVLGLCVVAWMTSLSFLIAGSDSELLSVLRNKGVLSPEEVAQIEGLAPVAEYPEVVVGGRIMADAAGYDSDDVELSNGTEFRRARLFISGRVAPQWFYKLQYELTADGADGFEDAYFGYAVPGGGTRLRVGQMIEAGSLEDTGSSKYITFMERGLPVLAFGPASRRMGVRADTHGGAWHAAAGVFGDRASEDESEDDGIGLSSRFSCAPLLADQRVLHLGISGGLRAPREDTARFSARPEAHVDDTRLVDTGTISNVNVTVTAGLEGAWVHGPLSVQGEYIGVDVDRDDAESAWLDGFYLYASWFLTGESRAYDVTTGEFVRLKPAKPFGQGGAGAWELALRYSELDLDDELRGGKESNVSAGVNWYVNNRTRFMLNYVRAEAETDAGDVDVDIAQFRAQIDF